MVATSVPQPTFGATGFVAPSEEAILAGVLADYQGAFGSDLNPSLASPQGQLASSTAAIIGNVNDEFVFLTQMFDPDFAFGRYQDALARIYDLARNPAQPTVLQINCIGLQGVVIPLNALIVDGAGNLYQATNSGTIPAAGNFTLSFEAQTPGPTLVPASNGVSIYQSVSGWDAVAVISGVVGNNVETRQAFKTRRALSVAQNSAGSLPSVLGAVLAVPGVIDAFVTENDNATAAVIGGVSLRPNSIYVAAFGGDPQAIAQAIWTRKAPGCAYNGNTTLTVLDQSAGYVPPYPAYSVSFEIPIGLPILFSVVILNTTQVPSNAADLIQAAILGAFAGEDGGLRATIGARVFASRFYAPVIAIGPWVQIVSIMIGSTNLPASQFTGSISGDVLTVTALASGSISVGQALFDATGDIVSGTQVVALGTGSGGIGTYVLNFSQTVSSEAMTGLVANLDDLPVQIDQIPTTNAASIVVSLSNG